MTPERWKRVKEIFDQVAELEPSQRSLRLDLVCGGDSDLRMEVDSLLSSFEEAGDFIEAPVLADGLADFASSVPTSGSNPLRTGTALGPYLIVQKIGEGGMGAVYQAVRTDDLYRKLVAIKVIRGGPNAELTLKRFDMERQILAHLDHPNIARLVDGGTTPDGAPYFVMDYIAGKPIDEYCDQNRLTVRDRLSLFLTVCSAVHYAHQNLVIHRDLKPQNILISEDGSVRLLDFGIAKLLDPELQAETPTVTLMLMMTPQFASPEQLRGEPVTTATDVYSLGVLLYQLLTGRSPYGTGENSALGLFEKICTEEASRPSAVVRLPVDDVSAGVLSELRGVKPDRLARQLSGDLDNIVLFALRKDPRRRYASVEQFASDIQRHLNQVPVLARPDTIRYRTSKFVRRHTAAVIAGSLCLAVLVAGIAATSWEMRVARIERTRAEQRFADVRDLAHSVLFEIHDAIEPLPGSTPVRQLLINRAKTYLDRLAAVSAGDDDALLRERALAYVKVGDVLGLPVKANLGNSKGALESYARALELNYLAAQKNPGDQTVQMDLVRTLSRLCSVESSTGRFPEALKHCEEASSREEALAATAPEDWERQADLASLAQSLSTVYSAIGNWPAVEQQRQHALVVLKKLHEHFPADEDHETNLANAYLRLASVQEQMKRYEEARRNAVQSYALFQSLSDRQPSKVKRRVSVTYALQRLGSILISMNDLKGAQEAFLRSLPIREQILTLDPQDANAQMNLANNLASVGYVQMKLGNLAQASSNFERQRALAEKLANRDPLRIEHQYSWSEALENLGLVACGQSRIEEGLEKLRRASEIYVALEKRKAITAEYASVPARLALEIQSCRQP